ncbi:MAG TPA: DoxX family membrane protein [Candidatus Stackebrandtia excrementipullorum]|nr:DoxX family membrane protein [Candidatus Stackebrandtia excrementipullorum]
MTTQSLKPTSPSSTGNDRSRYFVNRIWAVARIGVGWIFLWAFLDKLFGLGFSTPTDQSWLSGGRPTEGFLANNAAGPLEGVYKAIAGQWWADWLFMIGLAGIGTALILGIGMRIAGVGGAILLVLMWSVALPPTTNPLIDDHLIMAVLLLGLVAVGAGRTWGLGDAWNKTSPVKRFPILR